MELRPLGFCTWEQQGEKTRTGSLWALAAARNEIAIILGHFTARVLESKPTLKSQG